MALVRVLKQNVAYSSLTGHECELLKNNYAVNANITLFARHGFYRQAVEVDTSLTTIRYLDRITDLKGTTEVSRTDDVKLANFYKSWCKLRKYRKDWEEIQKPCKNLMSWGSKQEGWNESTNAAKSVIIAMEIRPTYEFSKIYIESRTANGKRKTIGGDSWRVHLRGPSVPVTTVYDLQNGTYEVSFLLFEPGVYMVNVYLEHSLCNGMKDPPDHWFIIGNAQGKYQPEGSLGSDYPYISEKMDLTPQSSAIIVNDQQSDDYLQAVSLLMKTRAPICNEQCNLLWDGYGRWIDDDWYPYKTDRATVYIDQTFTDGTDKVLRDRRRKVETTYNGRLWLYGDSVMEQFYNNIKLFGNLCRMFTDFNTTIAKTENDDKNFNMTRIINELSQVLQHPYFNVPESVILMNFGLHFVEGVKFEDYKILINSIIEVLSNNYVGKVVWRTTTSFYKHKLKQKHGQQMRFLNHQRVLLYNAYATSQMCSAGFPVLDVFPMTDSYPKGTGTQAKRNDPAHYDQAALAASERLLEDLFQHREI
eukprot:gene19989-21948_t